MKRTFPVHRHPAKTMVPVQTCKISQVTLAVALNRTPAIIVKLLHNFFKGGLNVLSLEEKNKYVSLK